MAECSVKYESNAQYGHIKRDIMRLVKITEHVYYFSFDSDLDRPCLGYIKGDNRALAVDAGHSSRHVNDFYQALHEEGLPLPDITVLTHWHWDHTFGMHQIHGRSLASGRTDRKLRELAEELTPEKKIEFVHSDICIRREYANNLPVIVIPADETFQERKQIDLGNLQVEIFEATSPHTQDTTLVYVPSDRVLFLGDATLGEFPSWRMDKDKVKELIRVIEKMEADTCVIGHWFPASKEEILTELKAAL